MARLQRTLSLGSVVLFGIAYMTPIIVLGTFGILAQSTAGMVPAAYLAALIAMFFTAMSYGRMAAAFPVAGSAYSYVRKAISPKLGFIAGWAVLLDYLFLPMAIWLIGAAYLASAFPSIPQWIWVLAFIGITSAINIIGLKLANGINALLMLVQFLVLIAFVALCVHYIGGDASTPLWSVKPFFNGDMQMPLIMSGAAIACYSSSAAAHRLSSSHRSACSSTDSKESICFSTTSAALAPSATALRPALVSSVMITRPCVGWGLRAINPALSRLTRIPCMVCGVTNAARAKSAFEI